MRHIATDVACSVVCLSVCLFVYVLDVLCKNGWTDRDAVWKTDSFGSKKPCVRWGSRLPREGAIYLGGCPDHWKALGVYAAVYAAKWIIQSSVTAWQRDCCSRQLVGVTLHRPRWRIRPLRCGRLPKFVDQLLQWLTYSFCITFVYTIILICL